jgi:dipeptidyl-peptidase-3
MTIDCDLTQGNLTVHVDRSKIVSHGERALGQMLLRLHMYPCTADVEACRSYYEDLARVDGEYLLWREIILTKKQPKWVIVQANTFLEEGGVILKESDATAASVVQSWAERAV